MAGFTIPTGTSVVTRIDRGGVPEGTAGTIEAGEGPYTVAFANGARLEYLAAELVVQRRQVRDELERRRPGFAELERFVVYETMVGSRAYGLDREGSDED